MKTVFITGAAGFLGRCVAGLFAGAGWRVVAVDNMAPGEARFGPETLYHQMQLPSSRFGDLLQTHAPNALIHCAGRASVPLSMDDPASDFRDNTVLTFEVLDALRRFAPACRFLFLSSAAVYGDPVALPVSESHRPAPLSPYGFHKWQCELVCEEFSRIYGLATASARIFSAYGPGLRRQVVWDICQRVLTTGQLALGGTGHESRDFIHATDIARALLLIAEKAPMTGEVYNLATGREASIAEVAALILEALGSQVQPQFSGRSRPGDPLHWRADISKIAALGFAPAFSLEAGLRSVAQWATADLARPA